MGEPYSRYRAARLGSKWFGYSPELQALDDLYNVEGIHVQVSSGKRRTSTKHFKEPPEVRERPTVSIADFNVGALAAQINA